MLFEKYYDIMTNHGICEFGFLYGSKQYFIYEELIDYYHPTFSVTDDEKQFFFDSFDELINAPIWGNEGLRGIWDKIEISTIDGVKEEDYDLERHSFNFKKELEERGEYQWSYQSTRLHSFLYQLKFAFLPGLIITALSTILPLSGKSNWNAVLLFGGCVLFALIISAIVLWKNHVILNYEMSTTQLIIFNGLSLFTPYSNIKKAKIKRKNKKTGYGDIRVYLHRGLSVNYYMKHIPEVDKVYALLNENIEKFKHQEQEKQNGHKTRIT